MTDDFGQELVAHHQFAFGKHIVVKERILIVAASGHLAAEKRVYRRVRSEKVCPTLDGGRKHPPRARVPLWLATHLPDVG